jgi:hypothetical protein
MSLRGCTAPPNPNHRRPRTPLLTRHLTHRNALGQSGPNSARTIPTSGTGTTQALPLCLGPLEPSLGAFDQDVAFDFRHGGEGGEDELTGWGREIDIAEPRPSRTAPERHHVEAILDLVDRWNGQGFLLIHGFAGTSRSAAAVLLALARLYPGREQDSVEMVQTKAPHIMPNRRLIDATAGIPLPMERVFKGFIPVPLQLRCD